MSLFIKIHHGEGLCPQSHNLMSCRRPLCAASHSQHQACRHYAKNNHPAGASQSPLGPQLDAVPSPWAPTLFSALPVAPRGTRRTPWPGLIESPGTLKLAPVFPCLRPHLPAQSSVSVWQSRVKAVRLPAFHLSKQPSRADTGLQLAPNVELKPLILRLRVSCSMD